MCAWNVLNTRVFRVKTLAYLGKFDHKILHGSVTGVTTLLLTLTTVTEPNSCKQWQSNKTK